jgi:uncharacterized protein YueI
MTKKPILRVDPETHRQISGCLFERVVLNLPKVSATLQELHPTAEQVSKVLVKSVWRTLVLELSLSTPSLQARLWRIFY